MIRLRPRRRQRSRRLLLRNRRSHLLQIFQHSRRGTQRRHLLHTARLRFWSRPGHLSRRAITQEISCHPGGPDSNGQYEDLQISNGTHCVVDGSAPGANYVYRNVNIWGGGSLTFQDKKINFHAHSILIENNGSMVAGYDAPLVGPLSIWLYGAGSADGLTMDSIPSITCQSSPTCGVPTDIWNSNPNVATMTMPAMGTACQTATTVLPGTQTPVGNDCFYQYEVFDKGGAAGTYFGDKVLAVSYGGTLYLRGQKGIRDPQTTGIPVGNNPSDSGTSWVRLASTITKSLVGSNSFYVDRPVPTWGPGDQIVLTSTDYLPGHSEELTISNISSDSNGRRSQFQHRFSTRIGEKPMTIATASFQVRLVHRTIRTARQLNNRVVLKIAQPSLCSPAAF